MTKEYADVLCVITPSGELGYALDHDGARNFMDKWRAMLTDEQKAMHESVHTYGGVVQIRMLKADFETIMEGGSE